MIALRLWFKNNNNKNLVLLWSGAVFDNVAPHSLSATVYIWLKLMQYLLGKVCTQVIVSLFYIHNLCWVEDVNLLLNVKLDASEACLTLSCCDSAEWAIIIL